MCDSPVVIQGKHLGSAIASPQRVRNCIMVRAKPRFSNRPRHCALVSSSRVLLELWDSKRTEAASPKSCHRTHTSFPLAARPCHRDGTSRLMTRMLCPLAGSAEGQGAQCCKGPWMGHLRGGRLCWWQMRATDGYMLFWPALIFLAGPLIARERYRQMQ